MPNRKIYKRSRHKVLCGGCSGSEPGSDGGWIQCSLCEKWWHTLCSRLSEVELSEHQKNKDLVWMCLLCNPFQDDYSKKTLTDETEL